MKIENKNNFIKIIYRANYALQGSCAKLKKNPSKFCNAQFIEGIFHKEIYQQL